MATETKHSDEIFNDHCSAGVIVSELRPLSCLPLRRYGSENNFISAVNSLRNILNIQVGFFNSFVKMIIDQLFHNSNSLKNVIKLCERYNSYINTT